MPDLVIPLTHCSDCGASKLILPNRKLRRGRCEACYLRFKRALKAAGTFEPITTRPPAPLHRVFDRAVPGPNGCLLWTGHVNKAGYGELDAQGRHKRVHRVAYELVVGPIPDGLVIDHLCHNRDTTCPGGPACLHRRCLNPYHLEAVTDGENIRRSMLTLGGKNARKTHCSAGHEYTPENTWIMARGKRQCRTCGLARYREAHAREKAAGAVRKR